MKKSIKKHIEIGDIVKPKESGNLYYMVVELMKRKFKCKMITNDEDWQNWEQEFYYNIDMRVYKMVCANYA